MTRNFAGSCFFISLLSGGLFLLLFSLFQAGPVYKYTLGKISRNYINQSGNRLEEKVPFTKATEENLLHWDAAHYKNIADNRYNIVPGFGETCFAFFPAFPYLWRITGLSAKGVSVLNYILFSLGVAVLLWLFIPGAGGHVYAISVLLPATVSFQIPYTESLFFLFISLAVLGALKNKYWLFFVFVAAAAATRPAVTIILLSFIAADLLFFFRHENLKFTLREILLKAVPIFFGTGLAVYEQYRFSGSFFKFMEAQSIWNHTFRIPKDIFDWSVEGFSMSAFAISFVVIPSVIYLTRLFLRFLKEEETLPVLGLFTGKGEDAKDYLAAQAMFYFTGICLFILFFQGGSLNGLQRYIMATPYFYICLFYFIPKVPLLAPKVKKLGFAGFLVCGILLMSCFYSKKWNFSDLGFIICVLFAVYFLFEDTFSKRTKYIFLAFTLLAAAIWKTYLFNSFLSDGWIFT
jgi:hypothetical protein